MVAPLHVNNMKVTLIVDDGIQGWTESFLYSGSNLAPDNAGLVADAIELGTARCKTLDGVNAKLTDIRISQDNIDHDSYFVPQAGLPVPNPLNGYFPIGGPDYSSNKWTWQTSQVSWPLLMGTSQATTNPLLYIAGMPARTSQLGPYPGDCETGPTVQLFLQAFATYLITSTKWGALARVWQPTTYTIASIAYIVATATSPPQLAITLSGAQPLTTFPAGSFIRMRGTNYIAPQKKIRLNGTYTVFSFNGTILTVNVPRLVCAPVFGSYGGIQAATPAFLAYAKVAFRKLTHKKRGRPLFVARGRR